MRVINEVCYHLNGEYLLSHFALSLNNLPETPASDDSEDAVSLIDEAPCVINQHMTSFQ